MKSNLMKKAGVILLVGILCVVFPVFTAFAKPAAAPTNDIGLEAAKTKALEHAGAPANEVEITKAKLDYDDGAAEYEVKFIWKETKYSYEINAASGAILEHSQKAVISKPVASPRVEKPAADNASDIGLEKAKDIALGHAGCTAEQVRFTQARLDHEDGVSEYEIEFYADGMEYEYEIHSATGDILDFEVEKEER